MAYASGKFSIAICDRCGFEYKYHQLKKEWTGFKVCSECYEPKSPQLEPVPHVADPQAIYEPRPVTGVELGQGVVRTIDPNQMTSVTGDPIGSEWEGVDSTGDVGTLTVSTS
jgi:hypothetical protein